MVKILVIGDLHGKKPRIHFKDFDYIISVGDICSDKFLRPYYKKYFKFVKRIGKDEVMSFSDFMDSELGRGKQEELEEKQMFEGRKILEYLNSFGVPVFFVPGNWDNSYGPTRIRDMDKSDYNNLKIWLDWWLGRRSNKKLVSGLENVYDLQYGLYKSDEFNVLGYGLISGAEKFEKKLKKIVASKREKSMLKSKMSEIYGRLNKLWNKRNENAVSIFVSHNVPYGVLDKIISKGSYADGMHAGSTVARNFCIKKRPEICVGGHIHEYYGREKLNDTVVVNSGYGADAQVLIDINDKTGRFKMKFVDMVKKRYRKKYGK